MMLLAFAEYRSGFNYLQLKLLEAACELSFCRFSDSFEQMFLSSLIPVIVGYSCQKQTFSLTCSLTYRTKSRKRD